MARRMGDVYPESLGIRVIGFCVMREADITGSRGKKNESHCRLFLPLFSQQHGLCSKTLVLSFRHSVDPVAREGTEEERAMQRRRLKLSGYGALDQDVVTLRFAGLGHEL